MSFGGFVRRTAYWTVDFFKGRPVGKHFSDLGKINTNAEKGMVKQQKYIDDLLAHATENFELYKDYKGLTIDRFPVVNKLLLSENRDKLKIDAENIPEQKTKNIHVQKTSGSTGVPFAVLQDTRKRNRRIAALKYFGEIVGFKSHERLAHCRVWTVHRNKSRLQAFRENIIPVNISKMDKAALSSLCETIHKKKVAVLFGNSHWIEAFNEYLKDNPQKFPSLKVIITSGEMLKGPSRESLMNILGCKVLERYANEECGVLGQQRPDGFVYYLNHASYYFELLKMESDEPAELGELGRIVITDLFNYAFPMIRYDTGDVGVMAAPDEYSGGYPILEKLYGRISDIIFDTEGAPIHPLSFSTIIKKFEFIVEWQFIQKDEKKYVMEITKRGEASEEEQERLIVYIKGVMGEDADISLDFVDNIPDLRSGKRKPVVCEWKRENKK